MENLELKKEEFLKLENRIWKTYQSRIKTATKLLNNSKLLDFYSTVYTICLTLLSVFSLINSDIVISYFGVFVSIIVMGIVFYGNSMNFKDRYINMKDNYLKVGDLYYECIKHRIDEDYNIDEIYSKYSNLLKSVENHTKDDYMEYLFSDSNERKKLTIIQKGLYLSKILFNKVVKAIIFLIPITFVIYSIAIII